MTEKKENRGGKRPGAGRPKGEPKRRVTIPAFVTDDEIDRLIAGLKADQEARAAQTNERKVCETA